MIYVSLVNIAVNCMHLRNVFSDCSSKNENKLLQQKPLFIERRNIVKHGKVVLPALRNSFSKYSVHNSIHIEQM